MTRLTLVVDHRWLPPRQCARGAGTPSMDRILAAPMNVPALMYASTTGSTLPGTASAWKVAVSASRTATIP
jgi:hypothetical protein